MRKHDYERLKRCCDNIENLGVASITNDDVEWGFALLWENFGDEEESDDDDEDDELASDREYIERYGINAFHGVSDKDFM